MIETERDHLEREFLKGKIPFALDESTYARFSERDTVFSRVLWDASLRAFRKRISEKEAKMVGQEGYSRIGYAASSASWMVHDRLAEKFSQRERKNLLTSSPTQISSTLPKYGTSDPNLTTNRIKRLAQIFGACDVGVASIDSKKHFVYSHDKSGKRITLPKAVNYAIVMLIQMDYSALMTSPKLPASITTGNAYSRAAFAADCMAETIRNLGHQAIPSVNSIGLSVPLAVQAGLGEFGRNGLLIHPRFGQSIRIAKVFTDLPLVPDSAINFGASDFCRTCKICAELCPSRSISRGEPTWESPWKTSSNSDGVYKWYVNADTCYEFWVRNSTDCSNCIRACPFTKPPGLMRNITRFCIKNLRFLNRFWVKLNDILGYGKSEESRKFWESKVYLDRRMNH